MTLDSMLPEPPLQVPQGPLVRRLTWVGIGVGTALAVTALIATQNWLALARAGFGRPWWMLFAAELPVWLAWVAVAPLIFFLVRRFPVAGPHRFRNLALHLPFALVVELITFLLHSAVRVGFDTGVPEGWSYLDVVVFGYTRTFALFLFVYGGMVAVYQALAYYRAFQDRAVAESRLETELARSELRTLRMQIHPHFLFNALHVISALMGRDVPAARRMMRRLSELLRLTLEADSAQEVTLGEELDILDHYVEIQRIRFQDRLSVLYELDPDTRGLAVPALVLQPLVENAILHGVARVARPGQVRVHARRDGDWLLIRVEDNGPGTGGPRTNDRGRGGLGLRNTASRLARLYGPGGARVSLMDRPEGGAVTELRLPARPLQKPDPEPHSTKARHE